MEIVLGNVRALLIAMKLTDYKNKKSIEELRAGQEELLAKVEAVEGSVTEMDKELFQKSLKIIMPIAQATERLQQAVGVK